MVLFNVIWYDVIEFYVLSIPPSLPPSVFLSLPTYSFLFSFFPLSLPFTSIPSLFLFPLPCHLSEIEWFQVSFCHQKAHIHETVHTAQLKRNISQECFWYRCATVFHLIDTIMKGVRNKQMDWWCWGGYYLSLGYLRNSLNGRRQNDIALDVMGL